MRAQINVPGGQSPVVRSTAVAMPVQARPRGVSFATEEVSRIPGPSTPLSLPLQPRVRTESTVSIPEEGAYSARRKSSFAFPMTPDSRWCPGYSSAIAFPGMTQAPVPLPVTMAAPPAAGDQSPTQVRARLETYDVKAAPGNQVVLQAPPGQAAQARAPYPQQPPGAYMTQGPNGQFVMMSPNGFMPMFQMPNGGYMQMPPGYQGFPQVAQAQAPVQAQVQQQQQQQQRNSVSSEPQNEPITTIMLRNIPLKYTRETLLNDMDARGFRLTYDFFYLPMDFERKCSVGYAFINFTGPEVVVRFKGIYQGLQLAADSAKVCEVGNAKVQGKQKNIQYYRNSSVMGMDEEYQPVIFENGVRVPFPRPTQTPKPFRPRAAGAGTGGGGGGGR